MPIEIKIERLIAFIDNLISEQMNAILHSPVFQRLRSSWVSLFWLIQHLTTPSKLVIKLISVNLMELHEDLLQVNDHQSSHLQELMLTRRLQQAGGEPFGLMIYDIYFDQTVYQVEVLSSLAEIASECFCPILSSLSPSFFDLESYFELKLYQPIQSSNQDLTNRYWQQLASTTESRFLCFSLPDILMSEPYPDEKISAQTDFLWGNSVYHYAAALITTYQKTHWFYDIECGDVCSLPTYDDSIQTKAYFTDKQEQQLNQMGIIVYRKHKCRQQFSFHAQPTLHSLFNPSIGNNLHYIIAASRFGHFIRVMMRDKIGSFVSLEECEHYLQHWLLGYCATCPDLSADYKLKYPLKHARVNISQCEDKTDAYRCYLELSFHHHIEHLNTKIVLTSNFQKG